MKKLFNFILIVLFVILGGYFLINEFDLLESNPTNEPPTEEINTSNSIFYNHYSYQGYLNGDYSKLSSKQQNVENNKYTNVVIEDGIDLDIMAKKITKELASEETSSITIVIYLSEDIGTKDLIFLVKGVDSITLYGSNSTEYNINITNNQLMTEIEVESFLESLSMIMITCNDYNHLIKNNGFILTA